MIPRLYVDTDLVVGREIDVDGDPAHYLRDVLRLTVGAALLAFNGRDGELRCQIVGVGKRAVTLAVGTLNRPQPPVGLGPWLAFAPLKRGPTDLVLQKATELGCARLVPVQTRRTVSERVRLDRWHRIATEAAEQCERLDLPEIAAPRPLAEALRDWPASRVLFACAEAGPAQPIAQAMADLQASSIRQAAILTGPEGGFAPEELDLLRGLPFVRPVSLGPRILKAETAALAALAVYQAVAGDGATERAAFPRG